MNIELDTIIYAKDMLRTARVKRLQGHQLLVQILPV